MPERVAIVGSTLDSTHQGVIIEGEPEMLWDNIPIAVVGSAVTCSKHGPTKILTGSRTITYKGKAVAMVGSKCACGATVAKSDCLVFLQN